MIVQRADPADASAVVLNEIVAGGGTTAHAEPHSIPRLRDHYLDVPDAVCCHLAEETGRVLGFKALGRDPALPQGWLDVGTFTRGTARGTAAGAALFTATCAKARPAGGTAINAIIRANNMPGLGCRALGFTPGWDLWTMPLTLISCSKAGAWRVVFPRGSICEPV